MAVTDYLRGTGTSTDPYIIHNAAAWAQFFNVDKSTGKYFEVIADIDLNGAILPGVSAFTGSLNGNGFKVYNFSSNVENWFSSYSSTPGLLKNIHIVATYSGTTWPLGITSTYRVNWINCRFDFTLTGGALFYYLNSSSLSTINNVIITYYGTRTMCMFSSTSAFSKCYIYAPNTGSYNITGATRLTAATLYLPATYSAFESIWIVDSVSIPYLAKNGIHSLTQKYAIKGSVKIGGIGKKRKVALLTSSYFGLLKIIDTNADGSYLIDMVDVYDPIYVMHYDDYGFPLFANTTYTIGAYIHPKTPNGYRYKCTTAGTSAGTLPTDPWPTSSNFISGTAIFSPEPVYAAETFLVSPHLYDFLTGQPV